MAAYVIADFEITDLDGMREYGKRVGATIAQYGGKRLVSRGTAELLEGEGSPHLLAIVEFESVEQARNWYSSPEYTTIKALRHKSAKTQLILVTEP
jgi:uncharacterized protein (DUF1330 family)